ncbi:hypothetical protein GCM10022407_36300 [Hymenobacter antarcticus]|uniref:Uncharacterized protein n=1 Tax=Hymenobacter antarcticus TaxID=486270 RepID=A0ABP7QV29_9BACT
MVAIVLALAGLAGCAHRPAATYLPAAPAAAVVAPQLLFLSCRMTAETTGSRLQVLRAEVVAGTLKMPDSEADAPDFVRVTQLDGQGQHLAQARVSHPLRRRVEHVAADQRTFQRSEVVLPTAEFFVRMALQPTAASIRVEEVADGRTTLLSELPVPPKS